MNIIRKFIKSESSSDKILETELKKILGYKPKNLLYYKKAFIHSSVKEFDSSGNPLNYERLEFLGDAMINAVIASYLFKKVPTANEGYLTQMRSKIVSRHHLNELGVDLNLIRFVKSHVSVQKFGENIHGNIFEALLGAIFLDRGYECIDKFIHNRVIIPYVDIPKLEGKVSSYKSLMIEWCQKQKKDFHFDIYEDTGNDKIKQFSVKLLIDSKTISKGRGTSKKKAEEMASKRAFFALQDQIENV
jgi:ribonuclease-3